MLRFALLAVLLAVVCTLSIDDESGLSNAGGSIEEYLAQHTGGKDNFWFGKRVAGKCSAETRTQTTTTNNFDDNVS